MDKENFFLTSDGAYIFFEDYGKNNKNTLILLHGYLCSSKFFHSNIEVLSKNNRVILVDLRGHGFSSKTLQNLTISRCAKDIYELIEYLNLTDVTLLGWSMGSSVVMEYYEKYSNKYLRKIGIIDCALYPFSPDSWNNHPLYGYNLDGMIKVLEKHSYFFEDYIKSFVKLCFKENFSKEIEEFMINEMKKTPSYIAFSLYNDFLMSDYTKTLSKIDIPLMICCADSNIFPKGIEMGRYYKSLVKKCYFYEFLEEGHIMFLENPELFNKVILEFVKNYK